MIFAINKTTGSLKVHSTSRWAANKEDKQLQGIQTNMKRKAMIQFHLHNKIRSLPQHTEQKELPLWQYLTSRSNKSVITSFFSPPSGFIEEAKLSAPSLATPVFLIFPKSVPSLIGCSANVLFIETVSVYLSVPPQRACSFWSFTLLVMWLDSITLPGTITM